MTMLILMYVYFDEKGDIKAITPSPTAFSEDFKSAMFPIAEVEDFLTGKKNPFDYTVKKIKKVTSVTYKIERKQTNTNYVRTLDNYLTEVTNGHDTDCVIFITLYLKERKVILELNPELADIIDEDNLTEIFSSTAESNLYFTKKGDPYTLLLTVPFVAANLVSVGVLGMEYENIDLSNCSLYTKKIVQKYGFRIKE